MESLSAVHGFHWRLPELLDLPPQLNGVATITNLLRIFGLSGGRTCATSLAWGFGREFKLTEIKRERTVRQARGTRRLFSTFLNGTCHGLKQVEPRVFP
jgi:hypothetical protein